MCKGNTKKSNRSLDKKTIVFEHLDMYGFIATVCVNVVCTNRSLLIGIDYLFDLCFMLQLLTIDLFGWCFLWIYWL